MSPIEILIGNDYYFELLQPRKVDLGNSLFAFQTKLGWVLGGKMQSVTEEEFSKANLILYTNGLTPVGMQVNTHVFTTVDSVLSVKPNLEQFWDLESLGITESPSISDDDIALEKFNTSVRFENGQYMVTWPW